MTPFLLLAAAAAVLGWAETIAPQLRGVHDAAPNAWRKRLTALESQATGPRRGRPRAGGGSATATATATANAGGSATATATAGGGGSNSAAATGTSRARTPAQTFFEEARQGVLRLTAVLTSSDLLRPWLGSAETGTVTATAWVHKVGGEGPLIVTAARLVAGASEVWVQVPAESQIEFKAQPVLVNEAWDIALLRLPAESLAELADSGVSLTGLDLREDAPPFGATVYAMGFPLADTFDGGVGSAKLTSGMLSGSERVDGYMQYQHSAPISPGNVGGPLFVKGSAKVVGMTFPMTSDTIFRGGRRSQLGQHNNFAVPSWRIRLMVDELERSEAASSVAERVELCKANATECDVRVPMLGVALQYTQPFIKKQYGAGCGEGVTVTRVYPTGMLAHADPPLQLDAGAPVLLTKVNGVPITSFGKGRAPMRLPGSAWSDARNLAFMVDRMDEPVTVVTCSCGTETAHEMTLTWRTQYDGTVIRDVARSMQGEADYERFAGVTVQQLTRPLLIELLTQMRGESDFAGFAQLAPFLLPQENLTMLGKWTAQPAVVVTDVSSSESVDGPIHDIWPGDVVHVVNGQPVQTLADWREAFEQLEPSCRKRRRPSFEETHSVTNTTNSSNATRGGPNVWTMRTRNGGFMAVDFDLVIEELGEAAASQELEALGSLTPAVRRVAVARSAELRALVRSAELRAKNTRARPARRS